MQIVTRWPEFMTYETIFGPKMSYFSPFLLPKDHIQEKFHHYILSFFHKTLAQCISSEV